MLMFVTILLLDALFVALKDRIDHMKMSCGNGCAHGVFMTYYCFGCACVSLSELMKLLEGFAVDTSTFYDNRITCQ